MRSKRLYHYINISDPPPFIFSFFPMRGSVSIRGSGNLDLDMCTDHVTFTLNLSASGYYDCVGHFSKIRARSVVTSSAPVISYYRKSIYMYNPLQVICMASNYDESGRLLYCIVLYGQAEHKPEGVPVPIVYFIIYGFVFVTVLNSPKPASPHQPEKRVTLWAAQIAGFTSLLVSNIG